MVHSRRVTVARARPRASSSRAKVSMPERRTENSGNDRALHQPLNWRRPSASASRGQAAVSGQEPGEGEPLSSGEGRLDSGEGSGRNRGGHPGTSSDCRDLESWAAQVPAMNDARNVRRSPKTSYVTIRS
jgi:hypothetical protein